MMNSNYHSNGEVMVVSRLLKYFFPNGKYFKDFGLKAGVMKGFYGFAINRSIIHIYMKISTLCSI